MRVLYFDVVGGVSGDMSVAALADLGADTDRLLAALATLPLGDYELDLGRREVNGIGARTFTVTTSTEPMGHRRFADIRTMLRDSDLASAVRNLAVEIFTRLAAAEGRVHGVAPEEVTFHEVGAVDSIVDLVAAAFLVVELDVETAYVSTLPLGSGIVPSQHGLLPVPAPATAELLKGFSVRPGDGDGELITPTGAAIIATLARPGEAAPPMRIDRIGYGTGSRTLPDRPNLLRLLLGTVAAPTTHDEMVVLETNIDDMNPEIYEFVMERLFAAGARDVWLAPVQMKKNRPGTVLRALAEPAAADLLAGLIMRETSAIGVRFLPVRRLVMARETQVAETEFGPVPVKVAHAPDGSINLAPEYEACRRLATSRGVPLKTVYEAARAALRKTR